MAKKKASPKAKTLEQHLSVIAKKLEALAEEHDFCPRFYQEIANINQELTTPLPVVIPREIPIYRVNLFIKGEKVGNIRDMASIKRKLMRALKDAEIPIYENEDDGHIPHIHEAFTLEVKE